MKISIGKNSTTAIAAPLCGIEFGQGFFKHIKLQHAGGPEGAALISQRWQAGAEHDDLVTTKAMRVAGFSCGRMTYHSIRTRWHHQTRCLDTFRAAFRRQIRDHATRPSAASPATGNTVGRAVLGLPKITRNIDADRADIDVEAVVGR
jgi:hypothetical protein